MPVPFNSRLKEVSRVFFSRRGRVVCRKKSLRGWEVGPRTKTNKCYTRNSAPRSHASPRRTRKCASAMVDLIGENLLLLNATQVSWLLGWKLCDVEGGNERMLIITCTRCLDLPVRAEGVSETKLERVGGKSLLFLQGFLQGCVDRDSATESLLLESRLR